MNYRCGAGNVLLLESLDKREVRGQLLDGPLLRFKSRLHSACEGDFLYPGPESEVGRSVIALGRFVTSDALPDPNEV